MTEDQLAISTANGPTTAYVVSPAEKTNRCVIVVQEWWGLNEHIKNIARRFASAGFVALAPDLYRGIVASDPDEASKLMHALDVEDGLDTISSTIRQAGSELDLNSFAIAGFCMGGTFALRAACEISGFKAAAPFYGDIPEHEVLKKLRVPTVFFSGSKDGWITPEKVDALEAFAHEHGLPLRSVRYDADHAFFNDTRSDVYDAEAAEDAWQIVIGLFEKEL